MGLLTPTVANTSWSLLTSLKWFHVSTCSFSLLCRKGRPRGSGGNHGRHGGAAGTDVMRAGSEIPPLESELLMMNLYGPCRCFRFVLVDEGFPRKFVACRLEVPPLNRNERRRLRYSSFVVDKGRGEGYEALVKYKLQHRFGSVRVERS